MENLPPVPDLLPEVESLLEDKDQIFSPKYLSAFLVATGISMRQIKTDSLQDYGPVEMAEVGRFINEKIRLLHPDDEARHFTIEVAKILGVIVA